MNFAFPLAYIGLRGAIVSPLSFPPQRRGRPKPNNQFFRKLRPDLFQETPCFTRQRQPYRRCKNRKPKNDRPLARNENRPCHTPLCCKPKKRKQEERMKRTGSSPHIGVPFTAARPGTPSQHYNSFSRPRPLQIKKLPSRNHGVPQCKRWLSVTLSRCRTIETKNSHPTNTSTGSGSCLENIPHLPGFQHTKTACACGCPAIMGPIIRLRCNSAVRLSYQHATRLPGTRYAKKQASRQPAEFEHANPRSF